jgi:glycosyltransferase involved in cell wall biosynthesis
LRSLNSADTRVKVIMFPLAVGNPYQQLLSRELNRQGADVVLSRRPSLRQVWTETRRGRQFLLHLHWQDLITQANVPGFRAALFQFVASVHLTSLIAVARLRGARVVWTIHNLGPHEPHRPLLDKLLASSLAKLVDSAIVHSAYAASRVETKLRIDDVKVAPHGNYLGAYPPALRNRTEVRARLRIPEESYVFLAFGQIRPYKNIPRLISAFRRLDHPDARLLIAGEPTAGALDEIHQAIGGDRRVALLTDRVPDFEVLELHSASDVAALGYQEIFSSGALLLALSCGVPVIAPAHSAAAEVDVPPVVRTFLPGEMRSVMESSLVDRQALRHEALATARRYDWAEMARAVLGTAG